MQLMVSHEFSLKCLRNMEKCAILAGSNGWIGEIMDGSYGQIGALWVEK